MPSMKYTFANIFYKKTLLKESYYKKKQFYM